ncbi:translation initiation factor IF-2 N-terminal domain-containing protein [Nocardia vaccinii]|uniref:translation initiation factor IF-2 N-terminal domain-containing protein n=1 Tax=Nocardia vaccinii TaxID=1822 RepID=UPI000A496C81|nr:translation initiation factor IF-2 N-terminal domain-containing protein [Nocardia vaccinii]
MADQEPQETSHDTNGHAPQQAPGVGEAAQLPERIRVHALAKLLGTTSKRILAHLTELGAEARSAQSSLDRTVAESVREAFVPADQAPEQAPTAAESRTETQAAQQTASVATATPDAVPEAVASAPETMASSAEPATTVPDAGASSSEASAGTSATEVSKSPSAGAAESVASTSGTGASTGGTASGQVASTPEATTAQPAAAAGAAPVAGTTAAQPETPAATPQTEPAASAVAPQRQSLFTSPFRAPQPQAAEPVTFEAPAMVAAPLFLPPDAAAAEEARRQRRAARQAKAAEEQAAAEEAAAQQEAARTESAADRASTDDTATATAETAESETESGDWDDDQSREDSEDGGRSRRRRRGRRGRGRGRGEQSADGDAEESEDSEEQEESTEESGNTEAEPAEGGAEDGEAVPEGSTRRRRRRRRRKAGEDAENEVSEDDPPNTVVHEREPRNKRRVAASSVDEVQGISGSTRLEAKRQRRRDGREAGRRRPPILTESEFLARRESVDRVMVVREKTFTDHPSAVTQVAVLEDNILVEHFVTSTGSASMVGNVYLGKVQNVLPSMEAAFVDIGRGRNGVLYAGEVNWEAAGLGGKERKIEQALKPGDTVLVQVSKDPVGHKGARLTTQISLAGRFLVYVPGGTSTGISRKLPDTERKRLKEILRDIVPQDAGVIIRTASEGVAEAELARDVERLQATWKIIEEQSRNGSGAPKTLYEEPDLLVKVIRDLFNEDFSKLVIEGERSWTTVENYIRTVAPDLLARVQRYDNDSVDVFGSFRIDEQLSKALDRKVWLPSGGTLVIDRTEAMTVIDVNTGKFTGAGGSNLEETVTRNNLEAAEEIVRQMRLRDIGGMIVVDFIDMVLESNRDLVLRRLTEALGRDRTRHQVSEVTSLGLVQMTRKKLGTGLVEAFSTTCEHCHGRGLVVHDYPVESAPAEDGLGRREGRRRRKDKDKSGTTAPAAAPVPVEAHAEEDAAAKRAHPVALAMAAHHGDENEAHADAVTPGVSAESAPEETAERPSRRRRSRSGRELAREQVVRASEAAESGDSHRPEESAAASEPEAGGPAQDDRSGRASELVAVAAGEAARVADAERGDESARANTAAESARPSQTPEPAAATLSAEEEGTDHGDAADRARTASDGAHPESARKGRRRVARSSAALSTDSAAAVFVLSNSDQPESAAASVTDFTPVAVPRSRPRRRSAGRAAGAPEQGE